ncbi:putative glutamine amidotransferase [Scopulibacillus darangshiensis]|uniref:Putative glutamine amidotransferase n=1 Tax=Scopulibacillus darangshiensis TaxID=442528 RepID=A0A4R2P5B9_9BACL|nr:gamma-glutamyl-gamma-aminobutyrate hydrolase family protein [Scopulibacillus darangshiensis]TCP29973.1 putative glutamine amidotransferase [Scopulibacillus darangshiensis]
MKPIIGVTSNVENDFTHTLSNDYLQATLQAGGVPVILPIGLDDDVSQIAEAIDGLVLSGGGDIDPMLFGEEPHQKLGRIAPGRDTLEIALTQRLLELNKPILAICRGIQIMSIAAGGDMYQDIYSQIGAPLLQHTQNANRFHLSHRVKAEGHSLIAKIAGQTEFKVNSFHHQAVRDVALPFVVSARSSDGVIEAIESTEHDFVIGVQWHPEALALKGDAIAKQLFESLVRKATKS